MKHDLPISVGLKTLEGRLLMRQIFPLTHFYVLTKYAKWENLRKISLPKREEWEHLDTLITASECEKGPTKATTSFYETFSKRNPINTLLVANFCRAHFFSS